MPSKLNAHVSSLCGPRHRSRLLCKLHLGDHHIYVLMYAYETMILFYFLTNFDVLMRMHPDVNVFEPTISVQM